MILLLRHGVAENLPRATVLLLKLTRQQKVEAAEVRPVEFIMAKPRKNCGQFNNIF